MPVIPFYGADEPELFAIERESMDRPGHVTAALNRLLPDGLVIDVGAGDGFTAARVTATAVAVEPATGMRRPHAGVTFVGGEAEHLPFRANVFDGAYSTWAYFFPGRPGSVRHASGRPGRHTTPHPYMPAGSGTPIGSGRDQSRRCGACD